MDQLYFSLNNISYIVWISAGVALVSMLWLLTFYRARVIRPAKAAAKEPAAGEGNYPAISVVVYANDNAMALGRLLPQIFGQDYPAPMEVVVVNDGSVEDVTDVVNRLSLTYKNLYQTFVPDEAHNLSRKKLGISLGIKAARNHYVVLTDAGCIIPSDTWLRKMAAPFAQGKEVSLGCACIAGLKGAMNRYDETAATVKWLSAALGGHPYRGTGFNLGYSRAAFFAAKGFSRSLTLHFGDDDVFVNQIVNSENTAVVLSHGSVLTVDCADPAKALNELRLRHSFTARFLPKGASAFFGFSTTVMWVWLAATVTGIVFSLPNVLPACVFLALIPCVWIPVAIAWRKSAAATGVALNPWSLPFVAMWRWTRTLRYRIKCGRASRRNYTWLQK